MGILKVEMPVDACAEKLSPMPSMVPGPLGTEMACAPTPVLFSPVGSEVVEGLVTSGSSWTGLAASWSLSASSFGWRLAAAEEVVSS